jgi:membrane associated rhomboid family serine protease
MYPPGSGQRTSGGGPGPQGGGVQFALPPLTPVTKKLMLLNAGIFLVAWGLLLVRPSVQESLYGALALDPAQWRAWFPALPLWQLVTHGFLHSTVGIQHVLWNMLQLYFFGTMLEGLVGSRRFLVTYLLAMVSGALLHLFVETASGTPAPAIGASGACLGVVVAAATLRPRAQVFVFFIPVPMWLLAGLIVLVDFTSGVTNLKLGLSDGVAHWVHLGGALWGFLCVRLGWIRIDWIERFRARRAVAQEQSRREDDLKMDRLLDKIHRQGMSSLTKVERAFLKRVSGRK